MESDAARAIVQSVAHYSTRCSPTGDKYFKTYHSPISELGDPPLRGPVQQLLKPKKGPGRWFIEGFV